jgi:hypothetical protein
VTRARLVDPDGTRARAPPATHGSRCASGYDARGEACEAARAGEREETRDRGEPHVVPPRSTTAPRWRAERGIGRGFSLPTARAPRCPQRRAARISARELARNVRVRRPAARPATPPRAEKQLLHRGPARESTTAPRGRAECGIRARRARRGRQCREFAEKLPRLGAGTTLKPAVSECQYPRNPFVYPPARHRRETCHSSRVGKPSRLPRHLEP